MEDKSKFDELLISYLADELDHEDEALVIQWINFDEENRKYLEKLRNIWKLTELKRNEDLIDLNAEWNHFKKAANHSSPQYSFNQFESLTEEGGQLHKYKAKISSNLFITTAIAASILLIIGFNSGVFTNHKDVHQFSTAPIQTKVAPETYSVAAERNTTGKPKQLLLADGTEVVLADKSEISYTQPFTKNARDVTLKGKAYFHVAKDKTRPFKVISSDISTTVLGTRFIVTAHQAEKDITVRLFEGSVVIKPLSTGKRVKPYYLRAGQELVYNKYSSTVNVHYFKQKKSSPPKLVISPRINNDDPAIPLNEKGSWYMFNNQPLDDVFKQLENIYAVEILYSNNDVRNKYFIGKFEKSEPVENVLMKLANLNGLKVFKNNNNYILKR